MGLGAGDAAHRLVTGVTSHHHCRAWRRMGSTRRRTLRGRGVAQPQRLPAVHRVAPVT
ncbi:hypothetical protein A176_006788 [Myxococcus hansupus]|uniref:Uncharacterized protein n=1 Tax=Pseudomyxococcus hansupus TaxID=1297742 RepID=A0A0H4X2J4_9BACT|nr:hypothetical protein [Myxococcus hansupus]AKQ69876.1 hypothetical protein A176_006788 [Myxococcus hansupus]